MQGNFFFLAPMRFQRSPCPFHSIRVTPRHAVNESAHHETTGDKISQNYCYYLWTTTTCRKPSACKELYPLHASVWISKPGQHQYFIKGTMVEPARSGIRTATRTFCWGSHSPNTSKHYVVKRWDAKVSPKWICGPISTCLCCVFLVKQRKSHQSEPSPSIDKWVVFENPLQPLGQSMRQCNQRLYLWWSGIRVEVVNLRPRADICDPCCTRW